MSKFGVIVMMFWGLFGPWISLILVFKFLELTCTTRTVERRKTATK